MHGNNVLAHVNAVREDSLRKLEEMRRLVTAGSSWKEVRYAEEHGLLDCQQKVEPPRGYSNGGGRPCPNSY